MAASPHSVLTQQPLLALIASFQRGVPTIARPLVLRFIGDGAVFCTNSPTRIRGVGVPHWYTAQLPRHPRIVTPLYKDVRPWRLWLDHVLPQAIAKYDDSLPILQAWLRSSASSQRTRNQIVHRVTEAAASFGRVDLLTWLYEYQQLLELQFQFQRHAITDDEESKTRDQRHRQLERLVRLAVHHGHANVLSYIETTYGASSLPLVVDRNAVWEAVYAGHVDVLRWLTQRGRIGENWRYVDHVAINRGHLAMLRFLLEECPSDTFPRDSVRALMDRAIVRGNLAIVQYLFVQTEPRRRFDKPTAVGAINRGHLDMAKFLLDHRHVHVTFTEQDVRGWICSLQVDVLTMLSTVTRCHELGCSILRYTKYVLSPSMSMNTLRLLVPLSLPEEIAMALVWTLLYNQDAAAVILSECTSRGISLPVDAPAFARQILAQQARLLEYDDGTASRAHNCYYWIMESLVVVSATVTEGNSLPAYTARLVRATVRELRAAILYLLWQRPDGDELPATLACTSTQHKSLSLDRAFLELCVELCPTEKSRLSVQRHLDELTW